MKHLGISIIFLLVLLSCSSPFLKYEKMEQLKLDEEIPVEIKEFNPDSKKAETAPTAESIIPAKDQIEQKSKIKNKKTTLKNKSEKNKKSISKKNSPGPKAGHVENEAEQVPLSPPRRQPEYESSAGFAPGSRRPLQDPYRVGEKVTMLVSYFKAKAGELTLETHPFVEVNGRKSYRWYTSLKTLGVFSSFYSVEDWAEVMADFETLVPSLFNLNVRESAQLKQAKGYFDNSTYVAKYYEKKYTEKTGQEEKRLEWTTLPFSQNVFSAAFYMRAFTYEVGKEYAFNVADDEKNVLFKAKCLRKEKLDTDAGTFDTIVIQPIFEINGVFKPMGEIFFWLSDDDRKFLLRIESEIKIGTIIAQVISLERGEH